MASPQWSCHGVAWSAAVLFLVSGPPSRADGMFYREIQKDGQVYVFAQMKEFAAWERSGQMSAAITRPRLRSQRRDRGLRQS